MEEKRPEFFALTMHGENQATDKLIIPGIKGKQIFLTSFHASYDTDGTNGLLQVFNGERRALIWQGRTMGGHLTMTMIPPLLGFEGEEIIVQLAIKAGIQACLSVTGYYLNGKMV